MKKLHTLATVLYVAVLVVFVLFQLILGGTWLLLKKTFSRGDGDAE
jgi:hypothetical protein